MINVVMDRNAFVFATREHFIKGKNDCALQLRIEICLCIENNLAYFPFMQCSLVAKSKAR